ncbi:MAG: rod shape-determining protein MreD [Gammaproteobacteria bacterium]|nr:MAG: rod shape-determining protein MreD [Gammaproteobacteria bacterium]
MSKPLRDNLFISLSLIIFLIIDLFSFPISINEIKPALLILCFIYWNIALPEKINLLFVLVFGFLLDLINGTLLGMYPLILLIISYFSQRYFYQFRPFTFIQQCLVIFLVFFSIKILLAIDFNDINPNSLTLADKDYVISSLWYSLLNSLSWPLIFFLLRAYRRRCIKT